MIWDMSKWLMENKRYVEGKCPVFYDTRKLFMYVHKIDNSESSSFHLASTFSLILKTFRNVILETQLNSFRNRQN